MNSLNNAATKQVKEKEVKNSFVDNSKSSSANELNQRSQSKSHQIENNIVNNQEKFSKVVAEATDKTQENTGATQGFLGGKDDIINEYAHQTIEKLNQIGSRAAETFANSSEYLKNFNVAETRQQVRNAIKEKPELSMAVEGVLGLLIGLLIKRKNN